jgi:hypothetical protein
MGFVSEALSHALLANERISPSNIACVRYTFVDQDDYPPNQAWFESERVRHIGDEVISWKQLSDLEPAPACRSCLEEWLHANGVDTSYSHEEQRFIRIKDRLAQLLRPRFEPTLQSISKAVFSRAREPTDLDFRPLKARPFRGYAGSRSLGRVGVEVVDHGTSLVGSIQSSLVTWPLPDGTESTRVTVTLENDELGEPEAEALLAWAAQTLTLLEAALGTLR